MSNVPLIRVPEFILHTHVKALIEFLRNDYQENMADITQSYLYKFCEGVIFERYNYFEQAVEVFINRDVGNPKYLEVDLMFNISRENAPTIHVTSPSESSGQNSIGNDEGYLGNEVFTDGDNIQSTAPVFTRRYKGTYDLVIVTGNSNECIMIYSILKALINATLAQLTLYGLENIQVGGSDLTPYTELMPKSMYIRTLRLNLEYETSTLGIDKMVYPSSISYTGVPRTTYYNQLGIGTDNL